MEKTHTVHLSDGSRYEARLVVYRDYVNSNGKWRLFWENPEQEGCGVDEQSTVTGQPFFHTMSGARSYGRGRYGITAVKANW